MMQLAIFGAPPAFPEALHVGRPNIGNRETLISYINDILDRRWLTNHGKYVQEFEQRVCDLVGVRHCIAMCNATVALEIAIRASHLTGEVIVPSMTFIATAHALQWQEITPVFCDIDPCTYSLDPQQVERMITPRTTGIIGVHLWGRACAVEELQAVADRHNLTLLFDAAHAFGCSYRGQMIGNFGAAEIFSFHATKFLNAAEGGAVVTNDDALAQRVRLMQNFGFEDIDKVIYIGTNGKMNELSAAMGVTSLNSLQDFIAVNYENYKDYQCALADIPGVTLIPYDEREQCNYQYIILEFDERITGLTREEMRDILWAENVLARRYFHPGCHRMEPYRSYFPHAGLLLPVTEAVSQRVMSLPTGTAVTTADIERICMIVRHCAMHGREISDRLKEREGAAVAAARF